jgi:hypothetical protein
LATVPGESIVTEFIFIIDYYGFRIPDCGFRIILKFGIHNPESGIVYPTALIISANTPDAVTSAPAPAPFTTNG